MPEPGIGRIVHYVLREGRSEGQSRPAQIVAVFPQSAGPALLNLVVTLDGMNDHEDWGGSDTSLHEWRTSIAHAEPVGSPPTYPPGTWHWPPGVS